MKTASFLNVCACGVVVVSTLTACASQRSAARGPVIPGAAYPAKSGKIPTRDGQNATYTQGRSVGGANGPEYAVRTGSMIPQKYNRRGYGTDTADPLFIYDQNDIRLQSTNTVGDSLRSVPGVTVKGPP